MKKLEIICVGLVVGIITGIFVPKEAPADENEPKTISVQFEVVETVEDKSNETVEESLPEVKWIPGNNSGFYLLDVPLEADIQEYVYEQCVEYNIDYYFVMALIKHESEFDSDCISSTNDYGLMQINICNHKEGVDYLDPYQNVSEGMALLDYLFNKYSDSSLVLMAYNMGENGASVLWNQGIYSTEYVQEIYLEQQLLQESIIERMN